MRKKLTSLKRLARRAFAGNEPKSWTDLEHFEESWKARIQFMAAYILPGDTVVDLGCGPMWLKQYLPKGSKYFGIDYRARDEGTIVCDLNKEPLPRIPADIYFISGCLEYIENLDDLLSQIARLTSKCVVSYCCREDFPDDQYRKERAWVNSFGLQELQQMFRAAGLECNEVRKLPSGNKVFLFANTPKG